MGCFFNKEFQGPNLFRSYEGPRGWVGRSIDSAQNLTMLCLGLRVNSRVRPLLKNISFALFLTVNLEQQASQESFKTAKKAPRTTTWSLQEPLQKGSTFRPMFTRKWSPKLAQSVSEIVQKQSRMEPENIPKMYNNIPKKIPEWTKIPVRESQQIRTEVSWKLFFSRWPHDGSR